MKNNFTQALKELTGFDTEPTIQEDPPQHIDIAPHDGTYITSTMVIKGNIKSKDNIFIDGEVIGHIHTKGDISISNLVLGDVSAQNMFLKGARLKGDIKLETDLVMNSDSVIVGNILCGNITAKGKIKGNCNIANTAKLSKDSYIAGDISAENIEAEQGAKIQGKVSTKMPEQDIKGIFEFGGDF